MVIKLVGDEEILTTFVFIVDGLNSEVIVEGRMVTEVEDSEDSEVIGVETTELYVTVWLLGYMGVMLCMDDVT